MHPTHKLPSSSRRCLAPCVALITLALLSGCAASPELAAQTPEKVHAAPADYAGNDCDMLARFLPVMQHGYRVTAGFQHTVYGWHMSAIEQVQREKGCGDPRAATAAKSAASGQLAVQLEPVTPAAARTLGMPAARGALVTQTTAPTTGLLPRDVILEIAGQQVQTPAELKSIVGLMAPGYKAPMRVWRNGSMLELTVDVGASQAALTVVTKR